MKDKKKIIIGALCALVMIMAVGYALLSQQLQITGSAAITSNWQVEITNIRELEKSTGATTNNTSKTATTASFNTSLTSPGDYALYEVTVTNKGTLDAVLSAEPTVTTGNNTAIIYELSGIAQGDKLPATTNNTDTFTIKVQYNPNVTSQPANLTSDIEVTLNYQQDLGQSEVNPTTTGFTGTVYRYDSLVQYNGTLVDGNGYCVYKGINHEFEKKYCVDSLEKCHLMLDNIPDDGNEADDAISEEESECLQESITLQEALGTTYTEETKGNMNKDYYLKHIINNGILEETYVCFILDREYCMKGADPSAYSINVGILESKETWFNDRDGGCELDASGDYSYCDALDGARFIETESDGRVNIENSLSSCTVGADGDSWCTGE